MRCLNGLGCLLASARRDVRIADSCVRSPAFFGIVILQHISLNQCAIGVRMLKRVLCFLPILAFAAVGLAQEVTSVILGVVSDPTDAVVPRAALTAIEAGTGQIRNAVSDEAGRFRRRDRKST